MSKDSYLFGNFFLGLTIICGLLQCVVHFLTGFEIFWLHSFVNWFLLTSAIGLVGVVFLLRYLRYKQYPIAFWALTVSALATLWQVFVQYKIMSLYQEFTVYYFPSLFFTLGTGILFAGSLVFSSVKERLWLRAAGVIGMVVSLSLLAILVWSMVFPKSFSPITMDGIGQGASLIGLLLPLFYILNFSDEAKHEKAKNSSKTVNKFSEILWGLLGIMAIGLSIFFGSRLAYQGYERNQISVEARLLAQPFAAGFYAGSKGDTLQYRLLKPLDFDPQKKYPMVVCLPYTCADDNIRQVDGCPPARWLAQAENREKYPAFLFVPRCPPGTGWGGIPEYPNIDSLALEAIGALAKEPGVDEKRIYVTGVSRGGYGSWHFIGTRPDLFAAAVPVCGGDDPKFGRKMVGVGVWAFHGRKDRNVPVNGSRDLIAAIKQAGGNPRYTEFPDAAHNIWGQVQSTPSLLDWLFTQKRD